MRSRWSLISSWKSCNNLQTHLVKILQHQNNQYIKENLVGGCSGSFHMKGNRKSLEFLKTQASKLIQGDPWSPGKLTLACIFLASTPAAHCTQPYLVYCTLLCRASQVLRFLQRDGKALHQQEGYHSLCCDTRLIVVGWTRTWDVSSLIYVCTPQSKCRY